jgi:hypothetical protein
VKAPNDSAKTERGVCQGRADTVVTNDLLLTET